MDVIQQPLVVRYKDDRVLARAQLVHTLRDDPKRVDVEPRIRLVEDREFRLKHGHLQYLVPLLLAARETFVHRAFEELRVHLNHLRLFFQVIVEFERVEFLEAVMLHLLVVSEPQELRVRNARHLHRILKRHEHTLACTLVRLKLEQVPPLELYLARDHLVRRVPREHFRQGRFP